jgi:hypothetical protein
MSFGRYGRALVVFGAAICASACGLSADGELTSVTDAAVSSGTDASHREDAASKDASTHDAAKADGMSHDAASHDAGTVEATTPDATDAAVVDSAAHDTGTDSADARVDAPPADAGCNTSACPMAPSASWSVVEFAPSHASPCPAGFTTEDLVEDPTPGTACSCGSACDMTAAPDCADVTLQTTYGTGCAALGANDSTGGGSCQGVNGSFGGPSVGVNASTVDVSCTGPTPTVDLGGVTAQEDRVCVPEATTCASRACGASVTAGFQTCLQASGDQACPGSLPTKHSIGTPDVTCGTCPCRASAACDGTLTFYAGSQCNGKSLAVATGACVAVSSGTAIGSYQWAPSTTEVTTCTVGSPSAPSVTLGSVETVCCP